MRISSRRECSAVGLPVISVVIIAQPEECERRSRAQWAVGVDGEDGASTPALMRMSGHTSVGSLANTPARQPRH
ncbi:hypothetical protein [Nocardia niigatensis]|uniref:hypothetical protein n=1 Tax=Nocardia niigatensis TaxID=209249 RepID=UPI001FE114FF|nr:hypothetical protein [Nocardia niigatensis]